MILKRVALVVLALVTLGGMLLLAFAAGRNSMPSPDEAIASFGAAHDGRMVVFLAVEDPSDGPLIGKRIHEVIDKIDEESVTVVLIPVEQKPVTQ